MVDLTCRKCQSRGSIVNTVKSKKNEEISIIMCTGCRRVWKQVVPTSQKSKKIKTKFYLATKSMRKGCNKATLSALREGAYIAQSYIAQRERRK